MPSNKNGQLIKLTIMRLGAIIILLLIGSTLRGQQLDFKADFEKISKAINSSDAKTISEFAPLPKFGPVDYIAPKGKSDRILKEEFEKKLIKLFTDYPPKEFTLLDTRKNQMSLPQAVGKYVTTDNKKYYVIMMLATFEKNYGFITFHFLDKLPSAMKSLD